MAQIRCPVCGSEIAVGLVPAIPDAPFSCPHCRHKLAVLTPDRLPLFMLSVLLSSCLCLLLPVRGMTLLVTVIGAVAGFYWLGRFLRDAIAIPKLRRVRTEGNLLSRSNQTLHSGASLPRR